MRPDLPTGTVTFVFTDVEGSTSLLNELGAEAYADALADHRAVIREACIRDGGVEVDTQGDSFFFAFPSAPGAVAAAAQAQAALTAGPVRVRMGLHTGTPLMTDEGYVGADVHRAARIAAVAHGGQVVLSRATRELLDADVQLRDLGEHRLKDLPTSERLYQLGDSEYPPLKTLHQTNLPVPSTPFLGREEELAVAVGLLTREDVRLVTLTGVGGCGKTRLALQAAASVSEVYEDGMWWVPLAPLRDAGLVLDATRRALWARTELADHIRDRSMLLLFDNFEHVVDAAGDVASLLAACPNLNVLVTSRAPLHLVGEHEYPVPPMTHTDAVALFRVRAQAVDPSFEPDSAAAEICRRLDELPLAVELAAARVKALTTTEIVNRLERRLPLLTGGARDLPERQRTLRATIAWSHDLLTQDEQRLFARLAVFAGGGTLDAVEQVNNPDLDTLQSLIDKNLLRHTQGRYWMLETIREYAAERLDESVERDDVHRGLAEYLLSFVDHELSGAERTRLLPVLRQELDNLRSVVAYWIASDDSRLVLRLANHGLVFSATPQEVTRWLDAALAHADEVPERLRLDAFARRAAVAYFTGDLDTSTRFGERALEGYRRLGLPANQSRTLRGLADVAAEAGDYERARALLEQAIETVDQSQEEYGQALHSLAELERQLGNVDVAATLFSRSAQLAEEAGDRLILTNIFHGMGDLALARHDLEGAASSYRRSLRLSIDLSAIPSLSYCIAGLAAVSANAGDTSRAGQLWGTIEKLEREVGSSLPPHDKARYDNLIGAHVDMASAAFAAAVERGRRMAVDQIYTYALTDR